MTIAVRHPMLASVAGGGEGSINPNGVKGPKVNLASEPERARWAGWWKRARWAAAALVLAGGAVGLLASGWTVCEQRLATVGAQPVVRVCRPPTVSDPPVVGGLLVVLLLLLPDLAEVGLPGFVSLKRRVEDAEGKLAGLELHLAQTSQVQQTAAQDTVSRASAFNVNLIDFNTALEELRAKTGRDTASAAARRPIGGVAPQRAQLEAQLLRAWAELAPLVAQGRAWRHAEQVNEAGAAVKRAQDHYLAMQDSLHSEEHEAVRLDQIFAEAIASHEEATEPSWKAVLAREQRAAARARLDAARRREAEAAVRLDEARWSLDRMLARAKEMDGGGELRLTQEELREVATWSSAFAQEIELVEAAQRAVAQAKPVDDDKLDAAVRLAEGLVAAWDLRRTGSVLDDQRPDGEIAPDASQAVGSTSAPDGTDAGHQ